MLGGLRAVEARLRNDLGVPFSLLRGAAQEEVPAFAAAHRAAVVVCDFSPLRVPTMWAAGVAKALDAGPAAAAAAAAAPAAAAAAAAATAACPLAGAVPLLQVDAHNIVPCWIASPKQETAARTIRPKIHALLPKLLTDFPPAAAASAADRAAAPPDAEKAVDWDDALAWVQIDRTVVPVAWCEPGPDAARRQLDGFCRHRLSLFSDSRNDPNVNALSGLSPWLHFGQLGAQRAVLTVKAAGRARGGRYAEGAASFVEECVVRRELADNYCFRQPHYDDLTGAAGWAQETLQVHAVDKREHTYTLAQLEGAKSHEDIWNAAQRQLVLEGKMHGFLRMYWAKKILEWTETPAQALRWCIYLNDRYSLDGRDPNGYVGCAWSVMGIHDMGWKERPIFGKIRFMNYNGCKRKFKIGEFVAKYTSTKLRLYLQQTGAVKKEGSSGAAAKLFQPVKQEGAAAAGGAAATAAAAAVEAKASKNRKKARAALCEDVGGDEALATAVEQAVLTEVGGQAHTNAYRNAVRSVHTALKGEQSGAQIEELKAGSLAPLAFVKGAMTLHRPTLNAAMLGC